jgi:hypothetical protein
MFDNVITFLLALGCHFDQGSRLSHVGTEGIRYMFRVVDPVHRKCSVPRSEC